MEEDCSIQGCKLGIVSCALHKQLNYTFLSLERSRAQQKRKYFEDHPLEYRESIYTQAAGLATDITNTSEHIEFLRKQLEMAIAKQEGGSSSSTGGR